MAAGSRLRFAVGMSTPRRTRLLATFVLLAGSLSVGIVLMTQRAQPREAGRPGADPAATFRAYAAAWNRADDAAAARLTTAPRRAVGALRASRKGLDGAAVAARVLSVNDATEAPTARLDVQWKVPGYGPFSYEMGLKLRKAPVVGAFGGAHEASILVSGQTSASGRRSTRLSARQSSTATVEPSCAAVRSWTSPSKSTGRRP